MANGPEAVDGQWKEIHAGNAEPRPPVSPAMLQIRNAGANMIKARSTRRAIFEAPHRGNSLPKHKRVSAGHANDRRTEAVQGRAHRPSARARRHHSGPLFRIRGAFHAWRRGVTSTRSGGRSRALVGGDAAVEYVVDGADRAGRSRSADSQNWQTRALKSNSPLRCPLISGSTFAVDGA